MKNYFNTGNINSVLITGADGFIGSNLVDYLVSQDIKVKCLVYFDTQINWIKNQEKNIEIIKGDILDLDSLYTIVQGVDIVFHLAGIVKSL
ncbi:MAG: NAD-dependent epimerase/dehydratase family protein, partial [bacterium]